MQPLVACHRISRNPNREMVFTGSYNDDGEPILRASPEKILPGTVFLPTDVEERDYFLSLSAARHLTDEETALYETGVQTGFPVNPFSGEES